MSSTILIFHWKRGQRLPNTSILMPLCAKENDFQKMLYKFAEICQFQKKDVLYRFLQVQQKSAVLQRNKNFHIRVPQFIFQKWSSSCRPKVRCNQHVFFVIFFLYSDFVFFQRICICLYFLPWKIFSSPSFVSIKDLRKANSQDVVH